MSPISKVYQYSEPNLTLVGWMGFLGFPTYFVIWEYLFPQSYENLWLRLFCALLFLGLVFRHRIERRSRLLSYVYYQVCITICLPFFFFYMLLMNHWSEVWTMSFMAAIFLHVLLVHITWVMLAQSIVGMGLATVCAWLMLDKQFGFVINWAHMPIFIFTYLFCNLFYFRNQMDHEARVSLAKSFGAGIAHEMRNPLSGLVTLMNVFQSLVPNPKLTHQAEYQLSRDEAEQLHNLSQDALALLQSGNETIDLLLTSMDENRVSRSTFQHYSITPLLESAIKDFGYRRSADKQAISLNIDHDFPFLGSDTLFKYVLYNLFKNAFHHRRSEDFQIQISVLSGEAYNQVILRDNGMGIPPETLKHIFQAFYTTGKSGRFGLGLPFCYKVMRSFGGNISCQSELGQWTEFTLLFPKISSPSVMAIKQELIGLKSILLISEQETLVTRTEQIAQELGVELTLLNVDAALSRAEYEYEYDVIMIDLDSLDPYFVDFARLRSILNFTQAQLVTLSHQLCPELCDSADIQPIWLPTSQWLKQTQETLCTLLFAPQELAVSTYQTEPTDEIQQQVLLVDDNESLRKLTAILLEQEGFAVVQAEDGVQALETLEQHSVDLILMDIEMPLLDGVKTTMQIRRSEREYASIPVIAYTGDDSNLSINQYKKAGFSDHLSKPATQQQLLDKLACWIT